MNRKKLPLIGVLALVVIGCVLAAGCTGQVNTDPDQVNPASGALYTAETPWLEEEAVSGEYQSLGLVIVTEDDMNSQSEQLTAPTVPANLDDTPEIPIFQK